MKNIAFSLIELLVVIAIVGILSAVGASAYKTYVTRAAIHNSQAILNVFGQTLSTYYSKHGSWPASTTFNGQTITDLNQGGSFVVINGAGNVYNLAYQTSGATAQVIGNISDSALNSIPGYVAPVAATWGTNSALRYVIVDYNNTIYKICGSWSPVGTNTQDIPISYRDRNCQCENIQNIFGTTNNPLLVCPTN